MARLHGRNGRVYLALASGGTAEPLAFQAKWSMNFSTDKAEVTALGDTNKVYVAGLPDASPGLVNVGSIGNRPSDSGLDSRRKNRPQAAISISRGPHAHPATKSSDCASRR